VLQDQLLRDIEKLREIYGLDVKPGVWKGVSSYICRVRLEENYDPEIAEKAGEVGGDVFLMDLGWEEIFDYTVADADECEGCTRKDCYYRVAKNRAVASDVIVVNHHVLVRSPFLIKACDLLVIDEGHEFPDILIEAQVVEFSEKTIRDILGPEKVEEKDLPEILEKLRSTLATLKKNAAVSVKEMLTAGGTITTATLFGIRKYLFFLPRVDEFPALSVVEGYSALDKRIWKVLRQVKKVQFLVHRIEAYLAARPGFERIVEEGKWKKFRSVPLFGNLRRFLGEGKIPVAIVSATLDREYMEMMLSLEEGDYEYFSFPPEWEYGFEIKVVDVHPREDLWKDALRHAVELARSEYEKVIVLLTSKEHLDLIDTPLKQGSTGMKILLERFEKEGGVLAGADTFWKGIDVPGDKAVVIAKLPFHNPEDPLHAKRSEFLKNYYGEKMMWRYIKAVAKMDLKQGIGRLKRRREDTGTVYLVDNRVYRKFFSEFLNILGSYGNIGLLTFKTNPAIS